MEQRSNVVGVDTRGLEVRGCVVAADGNDVQVVGYGAVGVVSSAAPLGQAIFKVVEALDADGTLPVGLVSDSAEPPAVDSDLAQLIADLRSQGRRVEVVGAADADARVGGGFAAPAGLLASRPGLTNAAVATMVGAGLGILGLRLSPGVEDPIVAWKPLPRDTDSALPSPSIDD